MLKIRPEQMAVFSETAAQNFEDWTIAHLKRFFPEQCAAAGEPLLREIIGYGIRRAAAYGITAKRDTCKYIDLMVVFGRDFDTNERLPWARDILNKRRSPEGKMSLLFGLAVHHLRQEAEGGSGKTSSAAILDRATNREV